MKSTATALISEPPQATPHRYQVCRQAKNGSHYNHGPIVNSPEDAIALFLHTTPAFEGGGLRLWDHDGQRNVASAEWHAETTRMGFPARLRSNVFYDPSFAPLAERIAEREALEQTTSERIGMTV